MKSGNADGAKGCRFEITSKGYMTRHRADYVHDNTTYLFHTVGESRHLGLMVALLVATVDDSNWEPDGVTLQVRFCEGGSAYQETEIAAATLQTLGIFLILLIQPEMIHYAGRYRHLVAVNRGRIRGWGVMSGF